MTTHFLTSKFSFTEKYIFQPIQTKSKSMPTYSWMDEVVNFGNKEIMTRLVGIWTSVFAAADTIYYLGSALYKSASYALYQMNIISLTNLPPASDIGFDLSHAAMFAIATVIGSIVGVIYPGICTFSSKTLPEEESTDKSDDEEVFDYEAFGMTKEEYDQAVKLQESFDKAKENFDKTNKPVDFAVSDGQTFPADLPKDWTETSNKVQELWNKAQEADTFKQAWKTASISDKRVFTHLLDIEASDEGEEARANLVNIIYKDIKERSSDDYWASEADKDIAITSWPKQSDATYYHATRDADSLRQILTSGEVEVRHQGMYKGAFVSTQPEKEYGSYVVVFKRNIERMADIEHRARNDYAGYLCYWAGFKQNIPVNPQTVAKILLVKHNTWLSSADETPEEMAQNIKQWTGQDIEVEYYDKAIHNGVNNKHILPREWSENPAYPYA